MFLLPRTFTERTETCAGKGIAKTPAHSPAARSGLAIVRDNLRMETCAWVDFCGSCAIVAANRSAGTYVGIRTSGSSQSSSTASAQARFAQAGCARFSCG